MMITRLTLPPILGVAFGVSGAALLGLLGPASGPAQHSWIAKVAILFFLPAAAAIIWLIIGTLLGRDAATDTTHRPVEVIARYVVGFLSVMHGLLVAGLHAAPLVGPIAGRVVVIGVGLVFVAIGNQLPRVRPNMALGIRTRRTLADRELWMRLHRASGYALVGIGAFTLYAGAALHGRRMAAVPALAAIAAVIWMSLTYWTVTRTSNSVSAT